VGVCESRCGLVWVCMCVGCVRVHTNCYNRAFEEGKAKTKKEKKAAAYAVFEGIMFAECWSTVCKQSNQFPKGEF